MLQELYLSHNGIDALEVRSQGVCSGFTAESCTVLPGIVPQPMPAARHSRAFVQVWVVTGPMEVYGRPDAQAGHCDDARQNIIQLRSATFRVAAACFDVSFQTC